MSNTQILVCIGGPMDGQLQAAERNHFPCITNMPRRIEREDLAENMFRDVIPIEVEYYNQDVFAGPEASFPYWRHEGTSVEQCIQKLLTCYSNQTSTSEQ